VFDSRTNPATQYAGKYTLVIPGSASDDGAFPEGNGYGAVTVSTNGTATLSGSLADGTGLSKSVPVSRNGKWPLYMPLYAGKGSVWSWLTFDTNQPAAGLQGWLSWINPARAAAQFYPLGFTNEVMAVGSRYTPPLSRTNRVINLTNGVVTFEGGNLSAPFTNAVALTLTNRVIDGSLSNKLSLTLTVSSGLFNGSVTPAGTTRSIPFKGALFQNADAGYGYFLGTNHSGSVILQKAE
jgi:hypothetical protein